MHDSVLAFVHRVSRKHNLKDLPTLELGSMNLNGSARPFFNGPYLGIDIEDGPGVDKVLSSHDLIGTFEENSYEVVLCNEMLEHDSNPWETMMNIKFVLSPGGYFILTTRGNEFPYHNPPDRWRFLEDGIRALLHGFEILELSGDPQVPGWFALAQRR